MSKKAEPRKIPQSGVIPYRIIHGKPHIYLITSVKKGRWIVPKGILEKNMTPRESAILEAYEEAGIIGCIGEEIFGTYGSKKWGEETEIDLYPMKVLEAVAGWPEKGVRKRRVLPLTRKELKARIANPGLLKVLCDFADYMKREPM